MRHRAHRQGRQYAAIPNAAMRDDRLSIEARGMLALMMTYSDDWVFRREHLMNVAGIGRDKFTRVLRELAQFGYVRRDAAKSKTGEFQGSSWVIVDEPDGQTEKPSLRENTDSLKTGQPEKPTAGEPDHIRKPTLKKTKREENQESLSVEFDAFWAVVPRKVAKDKARAAYAKARKRASAEAILSSMQAYAATRAGQDEQYTAHPASWLNAGRWQDEPPRPVNSFHDDFERMLSHDLRGTDQVDCRETQRFSPPVRDASPERGGADGTDQDHGRYGQQAALRLVKPRRFG